jgi:hypothetical protein
MITYNKEKVSVGSGDSASLASAAVSYKALAHFATAPGTAHTAAGR